MTLSLTQKQAIKTHYLANFNTLNDEQARDAFNAAFVPDYFVWRGALTPLGRHDLTDKSFKADDGIADTAFVWGGATGGYINRSQGERDAFHAIFNAVDNCDPSLANVRTAFDDIFSGAGAGAVANRQQWRAAGRRPATVAEKILAIATVGGPTQTGNRGTRTNPDTMTFQGMLTTQDVVDSLNS